MSAPLLEVRNLSVEAPGGDPILEDVSFSLAPGEALGVVGESGSGKTTAALALLGYTQGGARITGGSIEIGGKQVRAGDERAARALRGKLVSYVPQSPGTSLNPSMRIGDAVREMMAAHGAGAEREVSPALENLGLPGGAQFQRRYPHQLSGGQQQRVCISIALVCEPPLVILDEPTTGLDVVTQAQLLDELLRLRHEQGVSMVYVAHDLAVIAQVATRIAVMYAGRIVEQGPARDILRRPRHPYTRGLLTSIPDHMRPRELEAMPGVAVGVGERPDGCCFAPRCPLRVDACEAAMPALAAVAPDHSSRCLRTTEVTPPDPPPRGLGRTIPAHAPTETVLAVSHLRAEHRSRSETVVAAEDVSFGIARGSCVALVGESGSGKTTIARTVVGLHPLAGGEIRLGDELLHPAVRSRSVHQRRRLQIIFQNPADALNPRHAVGASIARPARLLRGLDGAAASAEVGRLLELVRLPPRIAQRYPAELSGGERQRVGIARALAAGPDVIVCDEITSALDVSVQAAVLALLDDLRRQLGLGLLFITHDLGVVAAIADQVLVLEQGRVCEAGPVQSILDQPREAYTRRLLAAAPSVSQAIAEWDALDAVDNREETSIRYHI